MTMRSKRSPDPRLEQLLDNIRIREELMRRQLAHVGGNLGAVMLADLQAAHRSLKAALDARDALDAADAAFAVAAVIQRANMAVLAPELAKPAESKRAKHRNAIDTNRKRREKKAAREMQVRKLFAAGKTVREIIGTTGISRSRVYKSLAR